MTAKTLTTTLTETDAWGKLHSVTVTWMPKDITDDVEPSLANVGRHLTAHGTVDDPPVRLTREVVGGGVTVEPVVTSHAGWAGQSVVEFRPVHDAADLEPGYYVLAGETR